MNRERVMAFVIGAAIGLILGFWLALWLVLSSPRSGDFPQVISVPELRFGHHPSPPT